jgi:pyruvate dehydrogenase E2 component (dihydrolipoamide acetyltransferase)
LNQISAEAKALFAEAKAGNISPDKLKGASFTISNLGSLGIEHFTPVINPPQTGILGVDAITTRVREVNGEIKTYPAMGLSLTYDHRALDGAPASKFLMDLKNTLENFSILLCQ